MNMHIPAETAASDKPIHIRISIPTNVYFLSGIRNFTLDMAKNVAGFDEQWAYRFQTVVDELTNNAIEHGSTAGDEIDLVFDVEPKKNIQVTVSDHGTGPEKHSAAELKERALDAKQNATKPSLSLRGRGFKIIESWCDSVNFVNNEAGGISATAKKNYQNDEFVPHTQHTQHNKNVFLLEV